MNFRLNRRHKALIERAASTLGQSLTEFAVASLIRDASRVLEEQKVTVLTDRDRRVFLSLLASDSEPNAALRKAAAAYRRQRA
jgi:uncharacterized protein (DUF1778 family)